MTPDSDTGLLSAPPRDAAFAIRQRRGGRCFLIAAILASAPLFAFRIAPAQALTTEEFVERFQSRYESTHDLEAEFTQRATLKTLNETQISSGKVYIKKPGRMRWDYLKPEPQVILLKDNVLSVYTPDVNQLVEQPVSNLYRAKAPTAFLAGKAKLKEVFYVRAEAVKSGKKGDEALWRLVLRPKEDNPQLKELRLEIDPKTFDIRRSIIIDHFGNETDIRYINVRTNQGLGEEKFTLKLPPNVERVRPPSVPFE